ncbi:enoyl-CoA hydratase/isomerase family protein [Mycetocola reblochoni]|uniref:Enoyl-CoA hydratase n=2 Tax=Mycetocola reblochoni TaxID=331618 RepID=A0A1R4ISK5_9MICO|nr:enoyl-CoA hydratase-related protein [Mycetocola reblochoni]RLP71080.1 enoyl-CoA hydratase/isomerase family protein [Mycetocola reblochoni]SJN22856.1 Enoyl-CoA hydratase [Mycetocola reblochoni REB411]
MTEPILLSVSDGVARVTLNRPDRLNAIDAAAAGRWRDVAEEVTGRADVRAVVLDAAGPAFCAGGDVGAMAAGGTDGAAIRQLADTIHHGMRALRGGAVPIVAAVQGAVAGGGLGVMLTADIVVASTGASFQSRYANIGLTPDCGVSTLLPEAVGTRRALQLLLGDIRLDARTALEWGLVGEVVDPEDLAARADAIAASWASGPSAAYGQARRLLRADRSRSFAAALDDEAATIGAAFDTEDASTRIAAFVEGSRR